MMGTMSSSLKDLHTNQYLQKYASRDSIPSNDPFWNDFLSFTIIPTHNSTEYRLLEDSLKPILDSLVCNNEQSGNVCALIHVFVSRASQLKESVESANNVFVWQTYNSLFILRTILKYLIENLGEEAMLKQFHIAQEIGQDGEYELEAAKLLDLLVDALIQTIVDVPVHNETYAVILEAVNTLLVLLSVQMFSTRPAHVSVVYLTVMRGKCNIHSILLVKTLLFHYMNQDKCPHCLDVVVEGGSLIYGLASSLWNILTFSYIRGSKKETSCKTVLADQSLLLLLCLLNHCTHDKSVKNPYRDAIFTFINIQDSINEAPTNATPAFRFDYDKLFDTICKTLKDDQTMLLVYLLLHKNPSFKQYVIKSSGIETFVVEISRILYEVTEKSSHHIYMTLIVLLILSEDDCFDKRVHYIKVKNIVWYAERTLPEISLGGLIILILLRTIQYNMTRMHDKYLHTNCLAALANMSALFHDLHPYVCQKFLGLLENMNKKHCRSSKKLKAGEQDAATSETSVSSIVQDLNVIEEVTRMLLEIINSCLCAQLKNNINLLYTMLYNRHILDNFCNHSSFEDVMKNINAVVGFFSAHIQAVDQSPSVVEVSQIISKAALKWPEHKLKKFPELKFKYVEEGQPEDFFIPYLWSLVFHTSEIYWNSKNILIFNPHKSTNG